MNGRLKKTFALLNAAIISLVFFGAFFSPVPALAMSAAELADFINAQRGLNASVSGQNVYVGGERTVTAPLELNISSGVTVEWNAYLSGSTTSARGYLLNLTGGGAFRFNGGAVNNSGTGGQINAAGAGLDITVNGTLSTASNGISLNIAANDVTLTVNTGGSIVNSGSNSAVNVTNNITGVEIKVDGGEIRSVPSGYAINDGGGVSGELYENNTVISVIDGLVEAGNACAIRSSGKYSEVFVWDGEVRNNAASNTNATIYMNGIPDSGYGSNVNVTVSGGVVRTTNTSNTSYVIQTTRDVLISGGSVEALSGRAVNLVGMYSTATVTGGRVSTETGVALCTATTTLDDVVNARIMISGGTVEAKGRGSDYSGTAVRITGLNSTAQISGDAVVTAKSGLAVDASGRPQSSSVTVNGGFVFAWGNGSGRVVSPIAKLSHINGSVVAWDTADGTGGPYLQNSTTDLTFLPAASTSIYWEKNPDTAKFYDGIAVPSPLSFFQLNAEVVQNLFTLTVINSTEGDYVVREVTEGTQLSFTAKNEEAPGSNFEPGFYPPISGNEFDSWFTDGVTVDTSLKSISFEMPHNHVTVMANFKPLYQFNVYGGYISTNPSDNPTWWYYSEGTEIEVTCFDTDTFSDWSSSHSGNLANNDTPTTTFTMPNEAAWVAAIIPDPLPVVEDKYTLTVVNGLITATGGNTHECYSGTDMNIVANPPPDNFEFDYWEISPGAQGGASFNAASPSTVFIMPNQSVTVTAHYKEKLNTIEKHNLEIDSNGNGAYNIFISDLTQGDPTNVSAAPPPIGMKFSGWTIDSGGGDFGDSSLESTTFYMPDSDAAISAHYEWDYFTLTVENGIDGLGIGRYHFGETIPIAANLPPPGMVFFRWTISGGGSLPSADTVLVMPASNVTVTANYRSAASPQYTPDPPTPSPSPRAPYPPPMYIAPASPPVTPEPAPEASPAYDEYEYPDAIEDVSSLGSIKANGEVITISKANQIILPAFILAAIAVTAAVVAVRRKRM
ncbi:MAG: hypothetical protein FWG90_06465 [Oscillospiraceae bacterium]|nr:hypothetical protein [Oscillospiraceae bacterium]